MALASSTVEGVGLLIGGKHLDCRFDQLTASGHTNAQFEVAELIEYALPLLWRLGNTDQAEVARLLTTWRKAKTSGKLFDEETL